jgi:hypothetical protein
MRTTAAEPLIPKINKVLEELGKRDNLDSEVDHS